MRKLSVCLVVVLLSQSCATIEARRPENICAKYHERESAEWFECVQREKIVRYQNFQMSTRHLNAR